MPKPAVSARPVVIARPLEPVKPSIQPNNSTPSGTAAGSAVALPGKVISSSKKIAPYLYRDDDDDDDPVAVYNRCMQANADLLADKVPLKQGWRPNPKRNEAYLDGYTEEVRENIKARREKLRRNITFKDGIMCFTTEAEREIADREAKRNVAVGAPFPGPSSANSLKPAVVRASSAHERGVRLDDMEVDTALKNVDRSEHSDAIMTSMPPGRWKGKGIETGHLQPNGAASSDQVHARPIPGNGLTPPVSSTIEKSLSANTPASGPNGRVNLEQLGEKSTLRPDVPNPSYSEGDDDLTSIDDDSCSVSTLYR